MNKGVTHRKVLSLLLVALVTIFGAYLGLSSKQVDQLTAVLNVQTPGTYRVVTVNDGDTITVDMNGTQERIRFIGVDTPETQDPRKPVQCFGRAATNFTKQLIASSSNEVRLEADALSSNRDRYDRLLRYVYLNDGRLVQAEIIKQGYGFAYTSFPFTKSDQFKQQEIQARQTEAGLWSQCALEPNDYGGYNTMKE